MAGRSGGGSGGVPGSARLVLAAGATPLHPQPQTFEAMVEGWVAQQAARGLAASTITDRVRLVRRFAAFTNDWPWVWEPADVEEWTMQLRSGRPVAHSTLRTYQRALALFLGYVTDARYGWPVVCEERFGTHPVQICHEWNTLPHTSDYEGRPGNRPLTRAELQALFDYADEQTVRARRLRRNWRRSGTRRCSRRSMRGGCAVVRRPGSRWSTSPPTRPHQGWAASGCCRCATARRPAGRHRDAATCAR